MSCYANILHETYFYYLIFRNFTFYFYLHYCLKIHLTKKYTRQFNGFSCLNIHFKGLVTCSLIKMSKKESKKYINQNSNYNAKHDIIHYAIGNIWKLDLKITTQYDSGS